MTRTELFGILSTLMMVCSRATYFNSVFRGRTRPHAFSWLIWGVIGGIGFAAQVAEGAGAGSWARGVSATTAFILVPVALFRGEQNIRRSSSQYSNQRIVVEGAGSRSSRGRSRHGAKKAAKKPTSNRRLSH